MFINYFAYGSNMNPCRLSDRGVSYASARAGLLPNWQLRFDKMSQKDRSVGFANIQPFWDDSVCGIVYELPSSDLDKLDRFEGYPRHYQRTTLSVQVDGVLVDCVVYVANRIWTTSKQLVVKEDYVTHIREGLNHMERISETAYEDLRTRIEKMLRA